MARVINGNKAYDSGDVEVSLLGNIVNEVEEITYETTLEHQRNPNLKRKAQSWSMGKYDHSASITLPMHEAILIESAAGGNMLTIKPFDINVTYVNDYNQIVNDTIICKFESMGREVTGDMGLSKQYQLFVLDIIYNNA